MHQVHTANGRTSARLFSESQWEEISGRVAEAFRMTSDETERLRNKNIAKLIAATPFLAGCQDAARTAVAHLGTYILSLRETKPYFNATEEDNGSVLERLRLISNFKGGDPKIIDRALSLLALNMVTDYRRDAAEDVFLNKYNPVSDGQFEFEALVSDLTRRIEEVSCPEMEQILPIKAGPLGFWGY